MLLPSNPLSGTVLARGGQCEPPFRIIFTRSPYSHTFLAEAGWISTRVQQRLGTTSLSRSARHPTSMISKRLFSALQPSKRRTSYITPPVGTRRHPQDDRVRPRATVLKFLVASFVFHIATGICSWQLMERHPKLHPAVWILGTLQEGREKRSKRKRQKLEAQIEKMGKCNAGRPCRICGNCLLARMRNGDLTADVLYEARYFKGQGLYWLRYMISRRRPRKVVSDLWKRWKNSKGEG